MPELALVDFAGHHLRTQSYGFDGTDATYDPYGRPAVSYQPTYSNSTPLMAQTLAYDELNRTTQVTTYAGVKFEAQHPSV